MVKEKKDYDFGTGFIVGLFALGVFTILILLATSKEPVQTQDDLGALKFCTNCPCINEKLEWRITDNNRLVYTDYTIIINENCGGN